MTKIAKNTTSGNFLSTGEWQLLPLSDGAVKFIVYVEGSAVMLCVAETPTLENSFKMPDGSALEWPVPLQPVWVQAPAGVCNVYYIV